MRWLAIGEELERDGRKEALVLVTAEASGDEPRAPLLLNILVDRSGSMKGAPLAAAREAVEQLVDHAGPNDFVGLCVFDGTVDQLVPISPMDAPAKQSMRRALAAIAAGRGTALFQAVEQGASALQRILVPGRRPRLVLLTDGEPSVGPERVEAFVELGERLAKSGVSVHALGLARHYVAEVLSALTTPSANAFEHVDGPEGLGEVFAALWTNLVGEVATDAQLSVTPNGLSSLSSHHAYPSSVAGDALVVRLGSVSRGMARRVLFSGRVAAPVWTVKAFGSCVERGDSRQQQVPFERVAPTSEQGRGLQAVLFELELVAAETAAWNHLARKDTARAGDQLAIAERRLVAMMGTGLEALPVQRHAARLGDLRRAVEKGEGDIPLLLRRAQSAAAGAMVSQVLKLPANFVFPANKPK